MSNIDKRALREAVERAGQNDWEYVYTSDLSAPGRGYITVGGAEAIYCLNKAAGGVKQYENILRYIAAASPETMLALLNEMEAAEKRNERALELLSSADSENVWEIIGRLKVVISGDYRSEAETAAAAGKGE
ncbi:ead/Ea22-like family protein [Escherichia coli]|nr:ead/Ea22-like family protein [Escherichia coli]